MKISPIQVSISESSFISFRYNAVSSTNDISRPTSSVISPLKASFSSSYLKSSYTAFSSTSAGQLLASEASDFEPLFISSSQLVSPSLHVPSEFNIIFSNSERTTTLAPDKTYVTLVATSTSISALANHRASAASNNGKNDSGTSSIIGTSNTATVGTGGGKGNGDNDHTFSTANHNGGEGKDNGKPSTANSNGLYYLYCW